MPYVNDPVLPTTSADEGQVLWRYLTVPSFLSLLQKRQQFFPSIETLTKADPYEGRLTSQAAAHLNDLLGSDSALRGVPSVADIQKHLRRSIRVNCWHMNDAESAAMWKLYSGDHGLAIRTTLGSLKCSFDPEVRPVHISEVAYVNFEESANPSCLRCLFVKRRSFEHERELRVYVHKSTYPDDERGTYVCVALDRFIEKVFVSPLAESWLQDVIERELKAHTVKTEVVASQLYDAS